MQNSAAAYPQQIWADIVANNGLTSSPQEGVNLVLAETHALVAETNQMQAYVHANPSALMWGQAFGRQFVSFALNKSMIKSTEGVQVITSQ